MKTFIYLRYFSTFLFSLITCSCSNEPIEVTKKEFSIDLQYLSISAENQATIIDIPIKTDLNREDWDVKKDVTWIIASKRHNNNETKLRISLTRNDTKKTRTTTLNVTSKIKNYVIMIKQYGGDEVITEDDIKIKPYGGTDSEHQTGQDITNTYDGKFSTDGGSPYHSPWGQKARFPVTLEYYFNGKEFIDYLIYYTRSGNGNFGKLKLYTTTDVNRKNYDLQGEYDFREQSAPSRIEFPKGINATGIKFEILSGLGNFVSCDEMEFFRKVNDPLNDQIKNIFTDLSCSEVKPEVTKEQIEQLPSFFRRLANSLQTSTYPENEKRFRIQSYKAYSIPEYWGDKLKINTYSHLNNPTGIVTNDSEEMLVFVSGLGNEKVSLQCCNDIGPSGEQKMLKEGVNKISFSKGGNLFVIYENEDPRRSPAIKIHFPPQQKESVEHARVGFNVWDINIDQTDEKFREYMSKASTVQVNGKSQCIFVLKGKRCVFTALKELLANQDRFKGYGVKEGVNRWDNLVSWEQELCGIEEFTRTGEFNNLMHIATFKDGLYATNYYINMAAGDPSTRDGWGFKNNFDPRDMDKAQDNQWGPGHELGHMHQGAINWPSTTESSNNLFSNYVVYKIDKWGSRGSSLKELAKFRFAPPTPWARFLHPRVPGSAMDFKPCDMGSEDANKYGLYQGEASEMHMRMNQQIWTYFDRIGKKKGTIKKIFQQGRMPEFSIPFNRPGEAQLIYARNVAKAANMDMTEFFDAWGFFIPVKRFTLQAYGAYSYEVTQQMVDETKAYMSKFPVKCPPIQYIEDRKFAEGVTGNPKGISVDGGDVGYFTTFQNNVKITKNVTYTTSGRTYTVSNGEQAVAFELRKNNQIIWFANRFSFDVPEDVDITNSQLYAVQADGKRIEATIQ